MNPFGAHAAAPPERAADRRRSESEDALLRDEQALLAGAVQRLQQTSGAGQVSAWVREGDAAARVVAAAFEGAPPAAPDAGAFDAVVELGMATALSPQSAPAPLRTLVEAHGAAVAAPVLRAGREPLAVLVLLGRRGALARPRTLALLDAACAQLAGPLAAAQATRRLVARGEELARQERLTELGRRATEIAHEIRNPLVSVKTFLDLLPERGDDAEFTTRFLAVASQELERVDRLLARLDDRSSAQPVRLGNAAPARGVASLVELLRPVASQRNVALAATVDPGLPDVACDRDALSQMLLNLALNALAATPAGGRIQVSAQRRAGGVEIAIADSGPGLPAGRDVFAGSGLGLTITRRLAEDAGGHVIAEAAPAGGARFVLRLPAAA